MMNEEQTAWPLLISPVAFRQFIIPGSWFRIRKSAVSHQ
jgi:hypothetical protein